jgi:hypothetical protein
LGLELWKIEISWGNEGSMGYNWEIVGNVGMSWGYMMIYDQQLWDMIGLFTMKIGNWPTDTYPNPWRFV